MSTGYLVSLFIVVLPLLVALLYLRRNRLFFLLKFYLFGELCSETILVILAKNNIRNLFVANGFKVFQVLVLGYFFSLALRHEKFKSQLVFPITLIIAFTSLIWITTNGWNNIGPGTYLINQLFLLLLGCIYVVSHLQNNSQTHSDNKVFLFFAYGMVFYFAAKTIIYVPLEIGLSDANKINYAKLYSKMHKWISISRNLYFAFIFYRYRP